MPITQMPILYFPSSTLKIVSTVQSPKSVKSSSWPSSLINEANSNESEVASQIAPTSLAIQWPHRDITLSAGAMMGNSNLVLPRIRPRRLIAHHSLSQPKAAMPGSMPLSQFATSMSTLPPKKRAGNNIMNSFIRQIVAPSGYKPKSSLTAQQPKNQAEVTINYILATAVAISDVGKDLPLKQTIDHGFERSSKKSSVSASSTEIKGNLARTHSTQHRKRQRNMDQYQAENERPRRRSLRIRGQKDRGS